jgi:type IV pilus assembly protein PilA
MLQNIRRRVAARLAGEESGFTLIELLVVMLILGILAAIALPAFFNQKQKAGDAKAKEYVHTAQVAMETYGTEHGSSYEGAEEAELEAIEPALSNAPWVEAEGTETGYTIEMEGSDATQTFTLSNEEGTLEFTCTEESKGGCPSGGEWNE